MLAKDIIIDTIPPIRPTDTGDKAINWMDEFKVVHLPVVKGNEYLGLISDTIIYDQNNASAPLEEMDIVFNRAFVFADNHVYDVMKLVAELNLTVVPILDKNEKYLGCTTLEKITAAFVKTASINEIGAIVVLEMNKIDYSLAQIAQIIESNDTKILSTFISSEPDSKKMEVTLKLNREHIGGVLQTLNRYDYVVKSYFTTNQLNDKIQSRYDALMRFINI